MFSPTLAIFFLSTYVFYHALAPPHPTPRLITFSCLVACRLQTEHNLVEKEYQRLPKKEELEQHIKELSKCVEGLNDEISLVNFTEQKKL